MTPRTLIIACTWTPFDLNQPQWSNAAPLSGREKLLDQWLTKTTALNPECDILLVDTPDNGRPSPIDPRHGPFVPYTPGLQAPRMIHVFPDNIGHLCYWRKGHRDGWGRAFCYGIEAATSSGYDYVAHIEGDAIFRHPVGPIIQQMQRDHVDVMSAIVDSGVPGRSHSSPMWVETGLMFMRTQYLVESDFVTKYDWPSHVTDRPAPEKIIHDLFGEHLQLMPWRVFRGHNRAYTFENIKQLDWITHANDPKMYDDFMEFPSGTLNMTPLPSRRPPPGGQQFRRMMGRGVRA